MADAQVPPRDSRIFITNLLSSIPAPDGSENQSTSNPLEGVSPETKNLLLTLHILFPNEFLPALDLLDRQLLTRFIIRNDTNPAHPSAAPLNPGYGAETSRPSQTPDDVEPNSTTPATSPTIFFVRSAQPSRHGSANSRFHDPLATHYEVRPLAWNCSCPAFAFSAYPAVDIEDESAAWTDDARTKETYDAQWSGGKEKEAWLFGGLGRGRTAPVCKHLLACVLVERVALFGGMAEERDISAEELAGWAAGWGG